ncbi:MAG: restriction endonuclease subunit S [Candidimonas sp.]|nr:MAG: restriction endonuclease subunit S [Candidimonas sp.]
MKAWPRVMLSEICTSAQRFTTPTPGEIYRQLGVRLWGEGAYERENIDGADTKYANFNRIATNDLVVNKIWARNGAVAIATQEQADTYVSTEFPTFVLDHQRIDPRWMRLLTKWRGFWSACDEKAQGTSGKNRIKPSQFLSIAIPLPPLAEQQALVVRLDALAEKTRQLEAHLEAAEHDVDALLRAYIFHPPGEQPQKRPMSELLSQRQPDVAVNMATQYRFAGVYSFGRGVFASVVKSGSDFAYDRLSRVRTGDFIYPKLMAWEGALGVVPEECDGMVVSPEFPVFSVNTDAVLPEVLDIYFRTPEVWPALAKLSGGTNLRRRRLQPSNFLNYEVPVPSMATQFKLREIAKHAKALKAKHAAIRAANAALLPAMLERVFAQKPKGDDCAR